MARVVINENRCKGCFLCISFCPSGALKKSKSFNKRGVNFVQVCQEKECLGCRQCAIICPDCCIEIFK